MTARNYGGQDERSSYWGTPQQFPDILSAPAPVLRDQDILIDGETVGHLPSESPSAYSFASPRPSQRHPQQPQQQQQQQRQQQQQQFQSPGSSPGYASRPTPIHTQPAATAPAYGHASPEKFISPAMSSLTTSPETASPIQASQYSAQNQRVNDPNFGSSRVNPAFDYDPYANPRDHASSSNSNSTTNNDYHRDSSYENSNQGYAVYSPHESQYVIPVRPPEVARMRQRRKMATVASGVVGGMAGLVILGPVGALAGGVGGAMLTKHAGKRMERKQTERIAAQRHAMEESRFGKPLPALQADSSGIL